MKFCSNASNIVLKGSFQATDINVLMKMKSENHVRSLALVKFSGLDKMLKRNLVTFNKTYAAVVSNNRAWNLKETPSRARALGQGIKLRYVRLIRRVLP